VLQAIISILPMVIWGANRKGFCIIGEGNRRLKPIPTCFPDDVLANLLPISHAKIVTTALQGKNFHVSWSIIPVSSNGKEIAVGRNIYRPPKPTNLIVTMDVVMGVLAQLLPT
jgi:hypothetical protein